MKKALAAGSILLSAGLTLGGCVFDDAITQVKAGFGDREAIVATTEASVNPTALSGPNAMPWQLSPASAASIGQGEATVVVDRPGLGRVRGTQTALAQLDQRIVPYKANGPIVSACKGAFEPQAKQVGAYALEAAAAGPETRQPGRTRTQRVFFRIFYADLKDEGVEVRQASIACTVGRDGALLKAAAI